jgi:hypothetical protein
MPLITPVVKGPGAQQRDGDGDGEASKKPRVAADGGRSLPPDQGAAGAAWRGAGDKAAAADDEEEEDIGEDGMLLCQSSSHPVGEERGGCVIAALPCVHACIRLGQRLTCPALP